MTAGVPDARGWICHLGVRGDSEQRREKRAEEDKEEEEEEFWSERAKAGILFVMDGSSWRERKRGEEKRAASVTVVLNINISTWRPVLTNNTALQLQP